VTFIEEASLAGSTGRARHLAPLVACFRPLAPAYSELRAQVVLIRKPDRRSADARA
jgi:hypothetical protein